jgi:Dinucleotide-utilizing enzymes involved in molybdopterin and thiamine biosynthesis family 2
MLKKREIERYDRQMIIPNFGTEGQEKLKKTKVTIAGVGGLGSVVSIYLTVAGIGHLKIIDDDIVEISNLNRQILHGANDIDNSKVNPCLKFKLLYLFFDLREFFPKPFPVFSYLFRCIYFYFFPSWEGKLILL